MKIIVVGGGAAGLMAAYRAAQMGAAVTILEKMPAIGRKILITGKGRCNVTYSGDINDFMNNFPGNARFLNGALRMFSNIDMVEFLRDNGVPTKEERGGRIFPESDQARDVVQAFYKALTRYRVDMQVKQPVENIVIAENKIKGVKTKDQVFYPADAVIVATGGASYPGTGSCGDGYRLAKEVGHTIVPITPSLVPLEVEEDWILSLQGLSLRNVTATLLQDGKKIAEEFGELLFTHYGLSGPIILSMSRNAANALASHKHKELSVAINMKPALSDEVLDKRIQRDFQKYSRKALKNALGDLLPNKMIDVAIDLAYLDGEKTVNQISKQERLRLMEVVQHFTLSVTKLRPISEAIVTAGGINVKEINPKTMQSKIVAGLYFAGEVMDIDGFTGGYNLQAAFSTGYAAGQAAAGIINS